MRIGIDAQFLGPRDRGLGIYTENLIRNLKKIDPPTGEAGKKNQYFILEYRGLKRHLLMPFQLKKLNLDLVHFTHFNLPVLYCAPYFPFGKIFRGRGKFVVTIHDLILSHVSLFKGLAYKVILKSALKRADKIIAVSEYTKKDILKHYKINPDKIKVIYEGVR